MWEGVIGAGRADIRNSLAESLLCVAGGWCQAARQQEPRTNMGNVHTVFLSKGSVRSSSSVTITHEGAQALCRLASEGVTVHPCGPCTVISSIHILMILANKKAANVTRLDFENAMR